MIPASALRLTTLAENTAGERGLLGEWGWSLLVGCGRRSFLLDAGAGGSTARNAAALGAELSAVRAVALSHGHHDHAGGLPALLPLLRDRESFRQDPLEDDQALFLRTELGLVVVLGCAHRGVLNTLALGRRLTGLERVYLVLGGTHLLEAGAETVERTISGLRAAGVEWLGVSHCTGAAAAVRLARAFGERFFFNHAGTTLRFPLEPRP